MASNSLITIWPKAAPALFEVGLDSEGDDMKQLNNAEQAEADVYPLQASSLCYSDFCLPVFKNCRALEGDGHLLTSLRAVFTL